MRKDGLCVRGGALEAPVLCAGFEGVAWLAQIVHEVAKVLSVRDGLYSHKTLGL